MKQIVLLLTLMISALSFTQQTNATIDINGTERSYILYLPTGYTSAEKLPLVMVYHGLGSNATTMASAGLNPIADADTFAIMYLEGTLNSFGSQSWNNGTLLGATSDDITFTNALMDLGISDYKTDINRIYVTGFSMGSIMSYHLACSLNDRVAAIAAMAGPMSTQDINSCNPNYLTPIIHFHGTADATVPYDSDPLPSLSLVTETLEFWENLKSCDGTADSTQIANTTNDAGQNLTTDRFVYNNCNAEGSLEHWRINGGGHDFYFTPTYDFSHAQEAWNFLKQWSHPNPLSSSASLTEENVIAVTISPNPVNDVLTINTNNVLLNSSYAIYSTDGKLIKSNKLDKQSAILNVADLNDGIYMITIFNASKKLKTTKFVKQ